MAFNCTEVNFAEGKFEVMDGFVEDVMSKRIIAVGTAWHPRGHQVSKTQIACSFTFCPRIRIGAETGQSVML